MPRRREVMAGFDAIPAVNDADRTAPPPKPDSAASEASFRQRARQRHPAPTRLCPQLVQAIPLSRRRPRAGGPRMKAWKARASFEPGTSLKAWTFMILRNQFYSEKRRSWRQSQLDQEAGRTHPGRGRRSRGARRSRRTAHGPEHPAGRTARGPDPRVGAGVSPMKKPPKSASARSVRSKAGSAGRAARFRPRSTGAATPATAAPPVTPCDPFWPMQTV